MPTRRPVRDSAVVVPFGGGAPALAQQLAALAGQAGRDRFEIVVAVNRPEALDAARRLAAAVPDARAIDATAVRGASAARNAGWRATDAAVVLFCDADDEVAPGWFAAMRAALDTHELVRSAVDYEALNPVPFAYNRGGGTAAQTKFHHLPFGPTCGLGIRRDLLEALGGFDEGLGAGEDIDLCWRAQYRGVELALADGALVRYRLRQTTAGVFRQGVDYGAADLPLYRKHRSRGARWDVRDTAKDAARLGVLSVLGLRSPGDRLRLALEAGRLVGRVRGAAQDERPATSAPRDTGDGRADAASADDVEPAEAPVVEASPVEVPVAEAPAVEVPAAGVPVVEVPVAEVPAVEASPVEVPVAEASPVESLAVAVPTADPEPAPVAQQESAPTTPEHPARAPARGAARRSAVRPVSAAVRRAPEGFGPLVVAEADPESDPRTGPEAGDASKDSAPRAGAPKAGASTTASNEEISVLQDEAAEPSGESVEAPVRRRSGYREPAEPAVSVPGDAPPVARTAPAPAPGPLVLDVDVVDEPDDPSDAVGFAPVSAVVGEQIDWAASAAVDPDPVPAALTARTAPPALPRIGAVSAPVSAARHAVLAAPSERPARVAPLIPTRSAGMEFADYLAVLRRSPVLLAAGALVGLLAGLVLTLVQPPVYESTTRVLVSAESSADIASVAAGNTLAQQVVATYADVAVTPYVLQPVAAELAVPGGVTALTQRVTATAATGSTVLEIQVKDRTAAGAAAVANAIAARLHDARSAITPTGASGVPIELTVVQAAVPAPAPSSPKPALDLLVGLVVGLVLAAGFALLRQGATGRIQSVGLLRRATDLPLLGAVGGDRDAAARFHDAPGAGSRWGEAFRSLRTSLDFVDFADEARLLVVASAGAGEGRTTTAANLAAALADADESVVLVDADLRSPGVATLLGLGGGSGLTDVLRGRVPLEGALRRWGAQQSLAVLPAGRMLANPSELLRSDAMAALLATLRARYTWVVVDTPPLGAVSDAALVARRTAGVVLVTRLGTTTRAQLDRTVEHLAQVGADVLGVVANDVRGQRPDVLPPESPAPARSRRRATHVPLREPAPES